MLLSLQSGIEACVVVTLIDGLVLARSAFHHSLNYRSVMIFGRAEKVIDLREKSKALYAFSEHIMKERWQDVREPTEKELAATTVLSIPLLEVSAKVRSGPPVDDAEDLNLPIWAGEIPLTLHAGVPVADSHLLPGIDLPDYAKNYSRLPSI
jgi:nitroimidazol reductase NimA-like FMN-containing flavoprotein (pyridoxamine 5'-phosphate oxidase superfamily)